MLRMAKDVRVPLIPVNRKETGPFRRAVIDSVQNTALVCAGNGKLGARLNIASIPTCVPAVDSVITIKPSKHDISDCLSFSTEDL